MLIDDRQQGFVRIGNLYMKPYEWDQLQSDYPPIPKGHVRRDYVPGRWHLLTKADGDQAMAEFPWPLAEFWLRQETEIGQRLEKLRAKAAGNGDGDGA